MGLFWSSIFRTHYFWLQCGGKKRFAPTDRTFKKHTMKQHDRLLKQCTAGEKKHAFSEITQQSISKQGTLVKLIDATFENHQAAPFS